MPDVTLNAAVAILLGSVAAVVLLIPTAAVQYRRDGKLGPGDLAVLLAAAVYGLSLWTYTLLPLPEPGTYYCAVPQTELFATLRGVPRQLTRATLHDPAFLQASLNVLLFVPFGFFVRAVLRRGFIVATVLGFGVSFLIEATQRTGIWGIYECAYRLFDVDDLMVNTAGAFIGSVLSWFVIRKRGAPVHLPTTISAGRRVMGMASDALFVVLLGGALGVGWRVLLSTTRDLTRLEVTEISTVVPQWVIPVAIQAILVLATGRTVGEWVISVRTVPRPGGPGLLIGRTIKFVTGVGLFSLLLAVDLPARGFLLLAFVVISLIAVVATEHRRGLTHLLGGLDLEIAGRPRRPAAVE